jgi:hypothetical protein
VRFFKLRDRRQLFIAIGCLFAAAFFGWYAWYSNEVRRELDNFPDRNHFNPGVP